MHADLGRCRCLSECHQGHPVPRRRPGARDPDTGCQPADQDTGQELWSYQTGSGIVGSPVTYFIDGKQYVAVPSGFGGWTGWATIGGGGAPHLKDSRKGGYVTVFGLFDE